MTESAHATIAALRSGHDDLAARVRAMSLDDLAQTSGAAEWDIAGVLSHLGSGAEVGLATLRAQLAPSGPIDGPDVQAIWDRWNATGPQERADGFIAADDALVSAYEGLSEAELRDARIDLGFMPEPVDLATLAGMRLNEQTLHGWDVVVASEPTATLASAAVPILVAESGQLIGFIGKAALLDRAPVDIAVHTTEPDRDFGLLVRERVSLADVPDYPAATLVLPAEAWLRLVAGRLAPAHTPAGVEATGAVSLDDLRRVFPGY